MPYIGKQLVRGQNRELDDISSSFNGATTTFNLTVAGDSVTPGSALQLFISIGGVLQNPNNDFTVAGNQITFSTAPGSGLSFFGYLQGDAVDFNTPADGSVTTPSIANNAVNNAKLADMAEGTIKARITAGTGDPEDATAEQIKALLKVPSEGIGYPLSLSTAELTDEADIQKHVMSAPGTITELRYQCPLAAPTGSGLELDVLKNGVSILSTRLTIDVGEISSETAAVPAVISDASFEAGDVYSFSRTQGDAGATARGDRIFMFYQET